VVEITVFNALLYLELVQRYENMVRIRGPENCNNNRARASSEIRRRLMVL